ncbi:MAG TPA: hypothetical protein PKJ41_12890, partial [Bryobacteraceae bacterium]|nr:hypothetical protein [Bryobacteraceae bacterium]
MPGRSERVARRKGEPTVENGSSTCLTALAVDGLGGCGGGDAGFGVAGKGFQVGEEGFEADGGRDVSG